jgi:AAA+ superfamily predicted ATPase
MLRRRGVAALFTVRFAALIGKLRGETAKSLLASFRRTPKASPAVIPV